MDTEINNTATERPEVPERQQTSPKTLRGQVYSLLRKSERFTKTDMVYLTKGGFWLSLSQVISSIFALILSIVFAHTISQETFGTYKFVLSTAGIITSFALSGLGNAAIRSVARGYEGDFLKVFFISLKWDILLCLSGLTISTYYFIQGNMLLGKAFLIVGCLAPLLDSLEMYTVLPSAKRDFRWLSLTSMVRTTITSSGLIITLFLTKNPLIIIFSYFLLHSITVLVIFITTHRSFKQNHRTENDTLKLGTHLSFLGCLTSFADKIDQILLFHYFGPVQLAIYNYAVAIPNNISSFTKNIGTLAMPKYAVINKDQARSTIFRKSLVIFLYGLPIVIIYYFLSHLVFQTFFPQYMDSIFYSQVYALALFINGSLPIAFLDAHRAIKEKYILNLSSSIFKIIAMLLGLYFFGLIGLIISRIISKLFGLILSWFLIFRI